VRRREFITLLGCTAAWPLAARAQQPGKLPTIGFLRSGTPTGQRAWVAAFVQRLRELGWIEGRTVTIDYRWGEGRAERFMEIAAELVRLNVDVILAGGTEAAVAAKHATFSTRSRMHSTRHSMTSIYASASPTSAATFRAKRGEAGSHSQHW